MRDDTGEGGGGARYDGGDARAVRAYVEGSRSCPIENPLKIAADVVTDPTTRTGPSFACHGRVLYTVLKVSAQQDRCVHIQIEEYNVLLIDIT